MKENVFGRIYKWRRVWAILTVLIMVVSLVALPTGDKSRVFAETNDDLSNFVSVVEILDKNNNKVEAAPDYNLTGQEYNIDIHYSESGSKNDFEFVTGDDGNVASMTYQYPAGVKMIEIPKEPAQTITLISDKAYKIEGNHYWIENNVLHIEFNTSDPNYSHWTASNNAEFHISAKGTFDENATEIDWGNGQTMKVKVDTKPHVKVEKTNEGDYYNIIVKSIGTNNNIKIVDAFTGSGYELDTNNVQVLNNSNWQPIDAGNYTFSKNASDGLNLTINSLTDSEVRIRYPRKLTEAGEKSVVVSADNEVTVKSDEESEDPGDGSHTAKTTFSKSNVSISKTSAAESEILTDTDGEMYQLVDWTVVVNNEKSAIAKGVTVSDILSGNALDLTAYDGNITLTKESKAGTTSTVNITPETNSWNYTIDDNDPYKYTFTYKTKTKITNLLESKTLQNKSTEKYDDKEIGKAESGANINPVKGAVINVSKGAGAIIEEGGQSKVTWTILLTVPGIGLNSASIKDSLPVSWNGEIDKLVDGTIKVTGLLEGETYSFTKAADEKSFDITFYKDNGKTKTGLQKNTNSDESRTVKITYDTVMDQTWLDNGGASHTNKVDFTGNNITRTAYATAENVETSIDKIFNKANDLYNGRIYGEYYIDLTGVTAGKEYTLEDEFGKYFTLATAAKMPGHWNVSNLDPTIQVSKTGNKNGSWLEATGSTYKLTDCGTYVEGDGKITFNLTNLPTDEVGNPYKLYRIKYTLIMKELSEEEKKTLEELAAASPNLEYTFKNNVQSSDFGKASVDGPKYTYQPVTKELTNADDLPENQRIDRDKAIAEYRITLNESGYKINNGEPYTVVDQPSNLSIDFDSITITPADADVRYYPASGKVYFVVPDEKTVTITYSAKIIDGGTNYTNKASIDEVSKSSEVTRYIKEIYEGEGTSSVYKINIMKFKDGDYREKLSGAVFQLLDADKKPIKDKDKNDVTFTTDSNGHAVVQGVQNEDGWSLKENVQYYLREIKPPKGYALPTFDYQFMISGDAANYDKYIYFDDDILTVKNSTVALEIPVKKSWVGTPAEEVEVKLYAYDEDDTKVAAKDTNGNTVAALILSDANSWAGKFASLPREDSNGDEIKYVVEETPIEGYTTVVKQNEAGNVDAGFTITNTKDVEKTGSLTVKKKLAAGSDSYSGSASFPIQITLKDKKGNLVTETFTDESHNTYPFVNGIYKTGLKIGDSITIPNIPYGYTYEVTELALEPENDYKGFVSNTIDNAAGTIADESTESVVNNKYKKPVEVTVKKQWLDNNSSLRPASIKVYLLRSVNGAPAEMTGGYQELNAANSLTYTWKDLPSEDKDGNVYTYTVEEYDDDSLDGYTSTVMKTAENNYTITNVLKTTKLKVIKEWDDGGYSERPSSVTVTLHAKGSSGDVDLPAGIDSPVILNASNGWNHPWNGLPQYIGGEKVEYYVSENDLTALGYAAPTIDEDKDNNIITLTNKRETKFTKLKVVKDWNDESNKYKNEPEKLVVNLTVKYTTPSDETPTMPSGIVPTAELSESNGWSHEWTDLPTEIDGKAVAYSVTEGTMPEGYIQTNVKEDKTENKITITNTLDDKTSMSVEKLWDDAEDQDGLRAPVDVVLLAFKGSEEVDQDRLKNVLGIETEKTLTKESGYKYTWTELPNHIDGTVIKYKVKELTALTGYTTGEPQYASDGKSCTITNKHTPEVVEKKVKKVWDNPSEGNKAPSGVDKVEAVLLKNNVVVEGSKVELTEANSWEAAWTKLPKYEKGKLIDYTVEELTNIEGYGWRADEKDGTIFLYNSLPAIFTDVKVTKAWDDENNQDGFRPKEITVLLYGNDTLAGSAVLSQSNNWTYSWNKLLWKTNDSAVPIKYRIEEPDLQKEEYALSQTESVTAPNGADGLHETYINATNKHIPKTTKIKVIKNWNDNNNPERPAGVTVDLLADGVAIKQKVLDKTKNTEEFTWDALPVYKNGKKIVYTVRENLPTDQQDKYSAQYTTETSSEGDVITITNTSPKVKRVSVRKVWDDAENQDGIRPGSVTVHLYADGVHKDEQRLDSSNGWSYTWDKLPPKNGTNDIVYTVVEDKVTGYENPIIDATNFAATGEYVITNRHAPEVVELDVTKIWEDSLNKLKRPAAIQVQLYADGVAISDKLITLSGDGDIWTGKWTKLPKKANGKDIEYTVKEVEVPVGYIGSNPVKNNKESDEYTQKWNITNTRVIPKEVSFSKRGITGDDELYGAKLKIVDSKGVVVDEWISGLDADEKKANEPHVVTDLEINEIYTLIEDTAPAGYEAITETQFTIDYDGNVSLISGKADENVSVNGKRKVIINDQYTSVKISKVDITTDKELPGAHLQILDEAGKVVVIDGKNVEWDSTDTSYEVKGLTTGKKYIIRETVAPSGYTITTDTYFQLDKYGKVESSTSLTTAKISGKEENLLLVEDGLTKLNFTKVGLINESCSDEASATAPLEGVSFGVYTVGADGKPGDTPVKTAVSNKNGTVVFDGIPAGKYAVKELSTIEPYVLDTNIYYADVSDDETKNFEGLKDADGKLITGNKLVNDQYRADIVLTKVSEYNPKEALPNSTYGLYKVTDAVGTEKLITTAVTDEQGLLTFKGVVTGVTYKVREMAPPDGYYVSKNPVTISFKVDNGKAVLSAVDGGDGTATIDANGNITWLEPSVIVSFAKTDEAGNYLAGAVLTVKDANGNVVKAKDGTTDLTWTSTSAAYEVEGVFEIGKTYTLEEVTAPKGYKKAEPVAFTIPSETVASNENKVVTVTMVDKKSKKTTDEDEDETSTTGTKSKTKTKTGDNAPVKTAAGLFVAMWLMFIYLRIKKEKL